MGSGVALPMDVVLFFLLSAIVSPSNDVLHFPFRFFINDVWWWLDEVSPMFGSFSKMGRGMMCGIHCGFSTKEGALIGRPHG